MSTNFSQIAAHYERDALVQRSAADKLLELLAIDKDDAVLDLGCGTGNLTRKIKGLTAGRVVGVDQSAGMIAQAKAYGGDIAFAGQEVAALSYGGEFDAIFCNSAFQWFREPRAALARCFAALRPGGRMGIQAPAREAYCPNFIKAMAAVAQDPRTRETFAGFRSPWLFLETADEYATLFVEQGFAVPFAVIEEVRTRLPVAEVITIFESGAAAGYLNQLCYQTRINAAYAANFRQVVNGAFARQAGDDGTMTLHFNRIYLLAVKATR